MKLGATALAVCLASFAHISNASDASARIITLTPHATEMVFAAGAGKQIVATVQSSDYPRAALDIERIGDGLNTSIEQLLAWSPDWVIGWPSPLMTQLQSLGIQTWVSNPQSLEAIGAEVLAIARAFGNEETAAQWHEQYRTRLDQVQTDIDQPLKAVVLASADGQFVIGRHALINEALARCGATNPFSTSAAQAPQISVESLIAVDPDVMMSGRPLDQTRALPVLAPLYVIDADTLYRPGPRFIEAALAICQLVQQRHTELNNR